MTIQLPCCQYLLKMLCKGVLLMNTILTNKTTYYNPEKKNSMLLFQKHISYLLSKYNTSNSDIVIVCIGSDRATGDCLGPLVGDKLSKSKCPYFVYGTLDAPVHAKNLHRTIKTIYKKHTNPFIIAIDASLGNSNHVGYVSLIQGALKPGIGVNKSLPDIGNISITGIVNISGMINNIIIQSTRLAVVMNLADFISDGLLSSY